MRFKVRPFAHNVNIKVIQIQSEPIPGIKHIKANIDTLPNELTFRIFELLQKASAVCLGLTCPRLYVCLKHQYPHPICLRCHEGCGSKCDVSDDSHYAIYTIHPFGWALRHHWKYGVDLGKLIKNWMGPQYTLVDLDVGLRERYSVFVHLNVYTSPRGEIAWVLPEAEHLSSLWTRYKDWAKATVDHSLSIHDPLFKSRLPKPHNKGDSWYPEAMAAIKEDIIRFDNAEDWRTFWLRFSVVSKHENTFNLWFEECSLEQMHDGIKLLGL
jgi:hypothetical protein